MNAEMWKALWLLAFWAACVLFFGTVLIVGVGGMRFAGRMLRSMLVETGWWRGRRRE
ncbi:MAG: hypothetical protein ABIL09_16910 [Gemmatimonadota bacterium]